MAMISFTTIVALMPSKGIWVYKWSQPRLRKHESLSIDAQALPFFWFPFHFRGRG